MSKTKLRQVRNAMVGLMNFVQPYAEACSCGTLESPTDHDKECPMVAAIKVMPWLNEQTGLGRVKPSAKGVCPDCGGSGGGPSGPGQPDAPKCLRCR